MGNDRVPSVHNAGVVTALIEHAHIQTEHIGKVDCTSGRTLIRADRHHVVAVDFQILDISKKTLYKLIGRADCLKSTQRDRILYSRIVSVESNNIIYAHLYKLL